MRVGYQRCATRPAAAQGKVNTMTTDRRTVVEGIRHSGAGTGYEYHGCRCDACTEAHRRRHRRRREQRAAVEVPGHVEHGLASTYRNWACRCWKCTAANSLVCELRRYDPTGGTS